MKSKQKVEFVIKLVLSFLLIATACIGYIPEPEYMVELTCISNFIIGILFLVSAIRLLSGKSDFENVFYGAATLTLTLVCCICVVCLAGGIHFNFKGAFFFLHVINPFAVLAYYLIYIDEKKHGNWKKIFVMPCMIMLYMIFDYVIGGIVGRYVYGFFKPGELAAGYAFMTGIVMYLGLLLFGSVLYGLNLVVKRLLA